MKKILALMVTLGLLFALVSIAFAETPDEARAMIPKVQAYIQQLEAKLAATKKPAQATKLRQMVAEQKVRLKRLQQAAVVTPPPIVTPPIVTPPVVVKKPPSQPLFFIGGNVGLIAGAVGVNGELGCRLPVLKNWFGIDGAWGRVGGCYAQGDNSSGTRTRMGALFGDGALNLPTKWTWGIQTYVGGGLNYVIVRSRTADGNTTGTIGGSLFGGVEGDVLNIGGRSYAELGYGVLRPSNGGSFKSANFVIGHRYSF